MGGHLCRAIRYRRPEPRIPAARSLLCLFDLTQIVPFDGSECSVVPCHQSIAVVQEFVCYSGSAIWFVDNSIAGAHIECARAITRKCKRVHLIPSPLYIVGICDCRSMPIESCDGSGGMCVGVLAFCVARARCGRNIARGLFLT